jgi:hypothetical protein
MKTAKSIIVVLFVLLTAQIASAYYCPSTGRWLSRDPIGEPGFENLRAAGAFPKIGRVTSPIPLTSSRWINRDPIVETKEPNRYVFVQNSPVQKIDVRGLGIANYTQYGNYCGAGYCGGKVLKKCDVCDFSVPAKNPMDSCCKDHDKCYDDAKGDAAKLHTCDQNLCSCLKNNVDPSDFVDNPPYTQPPEESQTMYNQLLFFACGMRNGGPF